VLVCHCKVVFDREIREVIDDGAQDVFDVADICEAGTVCGGCVPAICELLGQPVVLDAAPVPLPVRVG
jgi:bacterioferritin-associated ferredoxin